MHHYLAYGRVLGSELVLPELEPCDPALPAWTARHADYVASRPPSLSLVGTELIYDDIYARLWRDSQGWRVDVDDTGAFDWDPLAREITCARYPWGTEDFLRAHLLGRVLSTCLHDDGLLVLHGSAVAVADGAIAFLAPKGSGKSTLAAMLVAAGAHLLTDDALAVQSSGEMLAFPGVHSLRMNADMLQLTGAVADGVQRPDGKYVVPATSAMRLAREPRPLRAIYLLSPLQGIADGRLVARDSLPAASALAAVMGHTKVGGMLGKAEAPRLLQRVASVVRRIPVQRLLVVRDVPALSAVAEQVLDWHGGV